MNMVYHENSKDWDTEITTLIALKWNSLLPSAVMHPKDADGLTNSVDPDQTAPF